MSLILGQDVRAVFDRAAAVLRESSGDACPAACPCDTGADVPEGDPPPEADSSPPVG